MKKYQGLAVILILLLVSYQCDEEKGTDSPTQTEEGSWMKYSILKWTHDGNPISGKFCKVYSDGASDILKSQCLVFADKVFEKVLNLFAFQEMEDLRLPPENDKINVYINTRHEENIACAYWGTIFITIRTPELDTSWYEYLFKHELTHEFEFLIEGKVNLGTEVWFHEAIAIYCGGWRYNCIRTVGDIEDWISQNEDFVGKGNPIMIHVREDFPEGSDITGYNKVFDLTMKYLLDSRGLCKSLQDVLDVFYDMREGILFETSFQNHFGLSIKTFENEYYQRMREYLTVSLLETCMEIH